MSGGDAASLADPNAQPRCRTRLLSGERIRHDSLPHLLAEAGHERGYVTGTEAGHVTEQLELRPY